MLWCEAITQRITASLIKTWPLICWILPREIGKTGRAESRWCGLHYSPGWIDLFTGRDLWESGLEYPDFPDSSSSSSNWYICILGLDLAGTRPSSLWCCLPWQLGTLSEMWRITSVELKLMRVKVLNNSFSERYMAGKLKGIKHKLQGSSLLKENTLLKSITRKYKQNWTINYFKIVQGKYELC